MSEIDLFADLTDALSRGRLTMAEVAMITPRELDALFELGAERLDADRVGTAIELLGGLVALFPYSGRYWRAYGIALHRRLELERARGAYDASLLLQPGHHATLCYRGEVLFYLGEIEGALADLETVCMHASDGGLRDRAGDLLDLMNAAGHFAPPAPPEPPPPPPPPVFKMDDGRDIPLPTSRFQAPTREEQAREITQEITLTAGVMLGESLQDSFEREDVPVPPPAVDSYREATRHAAEPTAAVDNLPARQEGTDTAILRRRAGLIPRPMRRKATTTAVVARRRIRSTPRPSLMSHKITQTAVVRRRMRQPLSDERTLTDVAAPTFDDGPEDS